MAGGGLAAWPDHRGAGGARGSPLALHGLLPNPGNLAGLLETFLPWCGLVVPVLLVPALLRRSATALVALLVPAVVWLAMFGGTLGDRSTGKESSPSSRTTWPLPTPM